MDEPILWEETVQPAASWSHVVKRGTCLRITDIEGGANAGALFYNDLATVVSFPESIVCWNASPW